MNAKQILTMQVIDTIRKAADVLEQHGESALAEELEGIGVHFAVELYPTGEESKVTLELRKLKCVATLSPYDS